MLGRLDFSVYDQNGKPTLAVEAKRLFGKSSAWAASWRGNFMDDAPASFAECIHMLAMPDRIFVWSPLTPPGAPPTFQLDADQQLGQYFQRVGVSVTEIESRAFESLVEWWLRDLTTPLAAGKRDAAALELENAGIMPLIAGARIVQEDAA